MRKTTWLILERTFRWITNPLETRLNLPGFILNLKHLKRWSKPNFLQSLLLWYNKVREGNSMNKYYLWRERKGLALLGPLKSKLKNIHLGGKGLKILERKAKQEHHLIFGLSLLISYLGIKGNFSYLFIIAFLGGLLGTGVVFGYADSLFDKVERPSNRRVCSNRWTIFHPFLRFAMLTVPWLALSKWPHFGPLSSSDAIQTISSKLSLRLRDEHLQNIMESFLKRLFVPV